MIFTDYGGVENVGRLNDVCWRHLHVCVVYCNNGFGGIECENKIGWNDGRIRLDGKTKIVDRCRDAFTVT